MAEDTTIHDIQPVNIGSAAAFRNTVNTNFDGITNSWTGVYVGNDEAEAKEKLKLGGLWIVTVD